jgi:hypothetical protein
MLSVGGVTVCATPNAVPAVLAERLGRPATDAAR